MRRYLVSLLVLLAVGASAWAQKFKYETEPVLGKGAAPVLPAILSDRPAKFTYHIRTEAPDMFLTKGSSYIDLSSLGGTLVGSEENPDYTIVLSSTGDYESEYQRREKDLLTLYEKFENLVMGKGLSKLLKTLEFQGDWYKAFLKYYTDMELAVIDNKAAKTVYRITLIDKDWPLAGWVASDFNPMETGEAQYTDRVALSASAAHRFKSVKELNEWIEKRKKGISRAFIPHVETIARDLGQRTLKLLFGSIELKPFLAPVIVPKVAKDFPAEAALGERLNAAYVAWASQPFASESEKALGALAQEVYKASRGDRAEEARKQLNTFYTTHEALTTICSGITVDEDVLEVAQDAYLSQPFKPLSFKATQQQSITFLFDEVALYRRLLKDKESGVSNVSPWQRPLSLTMYYRDL